MKNKLTLLFLLASWFVAFSAFSQNVDYETQDKVVFEKYATFIQPFQSKSKELIL